ncbi:MAG: pentapeptide repeat-containing protein [Proteobacteria bacterium]|nr:MAG: pentapeptide repeat-containing protein [Pseudomonadota bacterium]
MYIVKKAIKFDLPIDGVKVKTVDDLMEHLTVELIEHIKSGLLVKWLLAREPELAGKMQKIDIMDKSDREILIAVFDELGFETDDQIIDAMYLAHEQSQNHSKAVISQEISLAKLENEPTFAQSLNNTEVLPGDDVSGQNFSNMNFSNQNLSGVNFSNCNLNVCNFDKTILKGANFCNANIKNSTFEEADLHKVQMDAATIENCNFTKVELSEASLYGCIISSSNFQLGCIQGASLYGSQISKCNFSQSDMHSVNLTDTEIRQCNFTLSQLLYVEMTHHDFFSGSLECAKILVSNFTDAVISGMLDFGGNHDDQAEILFVACDFTRTEISLRYTHSWSSQYYDVISSSQIFEKCDTRSTIFS